MWVQSDMQESILLKLLICQDLADFKVVGGSYLLDFWGFNLIVLRDGLSDLLLQFIRVNYNICNDDIGLYQRVVFQI